MIREFSAQFNSGVTSYDQHTPDIINIFDVQLQIDDESNLEKEAKDCDNLDSYSQGEPGEEVGTKLTQIEKQEHGQLDQPTPSGNKPEASA